MCEAPLALKASVTSSGIPFFSPVSKALSICGVVSFLNGIRSMVPCILSQKSSAAEAIHDASLCLLTESRRSVDAAKTPHMPMQSNSMVHVATWLMR